VVRQSGKVDDDTTRRARTLALRMMVSSFLVLVSVARAAKDPRAAPRGLSPMGKGRRAARFALVIDSRCAPRAGF